ncbi:MAG: N-acetyltransferase [Actinobacteria bacterium]|nr:MAG: N-acetyltransferase [Actinomycetota bacterium]
MTENELGQPIGDPLGDWTPPQFPSPTLMQGSHVVLEPLSESHAPALFESLVTSPESLWTYMSFGPFPSVADLEQTLVELIEADGWLPYAIVVGSKPVGFASYLRIDPPSGVLEIGSIVFSEVLQRTTAATEAIFMMIDRAFQTGYRRCEWKCDALNEPSRRAAQRLGFTYEGTFRKATHYKGRNRDTAWYAIVDEEWPRIRSAFETWLEPDNFDRDGLQVRSLSDVLADLSG